MPGAIIAFDQARPGGTSYGSPGIARNDLWKDRDITCRSTAGGNISYSWQLLDVPPGSAAALSNETTAAATFTPDLPGSYRVELSTNGGGPGNVQVRTARVRFDVDGNLVNRGWCLPSYGEQSGEANFVGNVRDWAYDFEFIIADLLTALNGGSSIDTLVLTGVKTSDYTAALGELVLVDASGGDVVITAPSAVGNPGRRFGIKRIDTDPTSTHVVYVLSTGVDGTDISVPFATGGFIARASGDAWRLDTELMPKAARLPTPSVVPLALRASAVDSAVFCPVGLVSLNPQDYAYLGTAAMEVRFAAVLQVQAGGGLGLACEARLVNLDTNVVVASFLSNATPADPISNARVFSSVLAIPGDLPNTLQTYELQVRRTGGSAGDKVLPLLGQFQISYR